jgi:hypothetical protein
MWRAFAGIAVSLGGLFFGNHDRQTSILSMLLHYSPHKLFAAGSVL